MLDEKNIEIFSSRDKIREQMLELSKEYIELNSIDFSKTSYMSYLIDILSIMTSNLMVYNTSVYREFFLTKSLQKESVLNISAMLGYNPPLATPSTVDVLFEIPLTFSSLPVSFTMEGISSTTEEPRYFKIYSADRIPFTITNTVTVEVKSIGGNIVPTVREFLGRSEDIDTGNVTTTSRIIPSRIVDGNLQFTTGFTQSIKYKNIYSIPTLNPYEFYSFDIPITEEGFLEDINIVVRSLDTNETVTQTWTAYSSLFLIPPDTYGFVYRQIDTGIRIFFGNGVIGRRPSPNSQIEIEFTITKGSRGNVISGALIRADRISIEERVANQNTFRVKPVKMNVINVTPALGGTDSPSIDTIRTEALANVVSNKRLVSSQDYSNIKTVVEDLPVNNTVHVLKRSDIKRNEISLFTELFFEDFTVPTRNEIIELDLTDSTTILQNTEYSIDGVKYLTLFDLEVDTAERTSNYYYNAQELTKAVTVESVVIDDDEGKTRIYPTFVNFLLNRNPDPDIEDEPYEMEMELNYLYLDADAATPDVLNTPPSSPTDNVQYIVGTTPTGAFVGHEGEIATWDGDEWVFTERTILNLDTLKAQIVPEWTSFSFENPYMEEHEYFEFEDISENIYRFKHSLRLSQIPFGEQKISFIIWDKDPVTESSAIKLAECFVIVVLRSDLNNYMYSQVEKVNLDDDDDNTYKIYDVPLIRKKFLDNIDRNTFTLQVMQRLTAFDVNRYKMLTDFVNLKFSNTTGLSRNMKYNKSSKKFVNEIDPSEIPTFPSENDVEIISIWVPSENSNTLPTSPSFGDRYIAGGALNEWQLYYIYEWDGYEWEETEPIKYDIVWVVDEEKLYAFNGDSWEVHSYRAAFSSDKNPWADEYDIEGGNIAHWSYEDEDWIFEKLKTNDIFYSKQDNTKIIYNGHVLIQPTFEIPLKIHVVAWLEESKTNSFQSLTENIKNKIVEDFFQDFGYDKSIYISKIIKSVQSISGVRHCQILRPTHDIFYSFNIYEDMTQQELLEYTPDLIYFTTDDITVEIRN